MTISKQELQINEEIRDKEILVIDADGKKLGVLSAAEAQKIAFEKDLDLVKIAPQATPPVCRIMDYGKYCFEQAKREKEARKNQKVVSIKEIRMFSTIDTHDFETKVNQAVKFLQNSRYIYKQQQVKRKKNERKFIFHFYSSFRKLSGLHNNGEDHRTALGFLINII